MGSHEASSPLPYLLLLCDCSFMYLFQGLIEPRLASDLLRSLRPALAPEPPASTSQVFLSYRHLLPPLAPASSCKGCGCLLTTPGLSVPSWIRRLCQSCHGALSVLSQWSVKGSYIAIAFHFEPLCLQNLPNALFLRTVIESL